MSGSHQGISVKSRNILILGAGGMAREVGWLINDINRAGRESWNLVGYMEHGGARKGLLMNGIPIVGPDEIRQYLPDLYAVIAIGDPKIKERVVTEAEVLGCKFATLIHPSVRYDPSTVVIAPGSIICVGSIITVNVTIGMHVIVNNDCTVAHDCIIEDYVTLSPGCHVSGHNILRRSSFLGTGSVTAEKCEIGDHAIIGAGAVVVCNIPGNVTAVGVPAKPVNNK